MNKEEQNNKGNRKRSTWSRLFARTQRVSAHITKEREWQTDVPNIKLSRAFVIVLVIHVVAVGGILAFEMFKPKTDVAKVTAASNADASMSDPPAASGPSTRGDKVKIDNLPEGFDKHIVQSGDSLSVIAARYGLTRDDITRFNMIDQNHPLFQGRVLRIPKAPPMAALDPATPVIGARKETTPETPLTPPAISDMANEKSGASNLAGTVSEYQPSKEFPLFGPDSPKLDNAGDGRKPDTKKADHSDWLKGPELNKGKKIVSPDPLVPNVPRRTDRPSVQKKIPRVGSAEPLPEKKAPTTPKSRSYKVKRGDTFYAIGRKFGVKYQEILKLNGISDPRHLQPGQVLRIP